MSFKKAQVYLSIRICLTDLRGGSVRQTFASHAEGSEFEFRSQHIYFVKTSIVSIVNSICSEQL